MGIEVVANRMGFYGRIREVGERFEIESREDLGDWMLTPAQAEEQGVPRVHEKFSSPARAGVGPNEAMAYAEGGQLTTALNLELKDAHSIIANLTAENARLEAQLAEKDGSGVEVADAKAAAGRAKVAADEAKARVEEAEKVEAEADFRKSEDAEGLEAPSPEEKAEDVPAEPLTVDEAEEATENSDGADAVSTDDAPRPTRRRRS